MMAGKLALALCCLIGAITCLESSEWLAYKAQHGKSYESQVEESMRRAIFEANKLRIEQFNAEESEQAGYRLGLSHLSDRTEAELERLLGAKKPAGWVEPANTREGKEFLARILGNGSEPIPDSVDWRKVKGRVTPVKNQGDCGSCWAFSTTGLLEGQELIVGKWETLVGLSEQQLVDCTTAHGCQGSWPTIALSILHQLQGIMSENLYPYVAQENGGCGFRSENAILNTRGPVVLPEDEEVLKKVVAKYGPVSIVFNVVDDFMQYKEGVYKPDDCGSSLDSLHAGLVVGYGTDPKEGDYWTVKNSWNTTWGEAGYFRIARNINMCHLTSNAVIAAF